MVKKKLADFAEPVELNRLSQGDYFGEKALMQRSEFECGATDPAGEPKALLEPVVADGLLHGRAVRTIAQDQVAAAICRVG